MKDRQIDVERKGEGHKKERKDKERYVIAKFCEVEQNWNLAAATHKEK